MLLDILSPYLFFISFFITLLLNITLILKNVAWYNIIIANVILTITMNLLGLGSYDFITQAFESIIDLIINLFTSLIEGIGNLLETVIDAINPFS